MLLLGALVALGVRWLARCLRAASLLRRVLLEALLVRWPACETQEAALLLGALVALVVWWPARSLRAASLLRRVRLEAVVLRWPACEKQGAALLRGALVALVAWWPARSLRAASPLRRIEALRLPWPAAGSRKPRCCSVLSPPSLSGGWRVASKKPYTIKLPLPSKSLSSAAAWTTQPNQSPSSTSSQVASDTSEASPTKKAVGAEEGSNAAHLSPPNKGRGTEDGSGTSAATCFTRSAWTRANSSEERVSCKCASRRNLSFSSSVEVSNISLNAAMGETSDDIAKSRSRGSVVSSQYQLVVGSW